MFITGNQHYLVNWKKIYPLRIEGEDQWKFSSELLKEGDQFKIVSHYYSDQSLDLSGKEEKQAKIDPKNAGSFSNLVVSEKPVELLGIKKLSWLIMLLSIILILPIANE